MGECGCDIRVTSCGEHADDVVFVMSREDADRIDRALTKAIAHLIAMADPTPYPDDLRWSPWTRFQKPLAERCEQARDLFRRARAGRVDDNEAEAR